MLHSFLKDIIFYIIIIYKNEKYIEKQFSYILCKLFYYIIYYLTYNL